MSATGGGKNTSAAISGTMGGPAANIRSEFFVHDEDFEDLFRLTKFHIQMSPRRQFRKSMRKGEKRIFKIFSKNNRVRRSSFVAANKDITAALSKHTLIPWKS